MTKLIAISGSLRTKSYNTALLHAAARLAPADVLIEITSIADIPLYNGDLEAASGSPAAVQALQATLRQADGLLIATPEYNNSLPGVLKNAIDWLSRPPGEAADVFGDLPVAVIGASPGGFGTVLAQAAWLPVLRTLGTRPWFGGRLMVSRVAGLFDADLTLTDTATQEQLRKFVAGFAEFAAANPRQRATQG
jgi:chromate reductase, NAD(P)H dehydrogenase (quinone)